MEESLVKLFHKREIHLLVLLSFTLQMLLLFTGSLRRRSTNIFIRVSIWMGYLAADLAAVYALGYLSQHDDLNIVGQSTQPLAFFWAPFLLIHLGGQDTITAFSMEDNNLWLRHLLNLVGQVVLAVYVFQKSLGRHGMEILVSGVFVFIAGVIKYGKRIWSLKRGSTKSLESSNGHQYKQRLPNLNDLDCEYSKIVLDGLRSMPNVHNIFAARDPFSSNPDDSSSPGVTKRMLKLVELELGLMYDDLYTKALVLRTRIGIILRCISHISVVVAFALFLASDKQRYSRADTVVTYTLFFGGIFLDLVAMFIFMMSPWTWAWLKARKCHLLASMSWFLFSSDIGWPERKPLWSNSMGQYNFLSWVSDKDEARTCNQRVMAVVRRLAKLFGAGKKKIFWMSKMLDTEYVKADEKTMEVVVKGINSLRDEVFNGGRAWPNLGPLLKKIRIYIVADFGVAIVVMHMFTMATLNSAAAVAAGGGDADDDDDDMVQVCRKLCNYMMYLFVNLPAMLPLNASSEATLIELAQSRGELSGIQPSNLTLEKLYKVIRHEDDQPRRGTLEELYSIILDEEVEPSKETLEEMADMWVRLLVIAAGRSRGELQAAQLASGGELITFVWLLMAREGLGESERTRVRMTSTISSTDSAGCGTELKEIYAYYFPH
ncbi:uncharacterized protein LOC123437517 [Hordeum vulgare subsp. vulgare]|uniref:DUF4220 domain-containing protein n=1 Tax=Hordeum vulgare subsp. vulgare TaxID=112509 RepID=A0A8I6WDW1_HORVV|nr:uncharacterized protein LOC123437517 [Hordeum vulgare subsp. vulgare]